MGTTFRRDPNMMYLKRRCPRCRRSISLTAVDLKTQCTGCNLVLELQPEFLSTLTSKALFFSGGLLIGSTLFDWLTSIGIPAFGFGRLLADLMAGVAYYYLCRLIFFAFQKLQETLDQ